MKRRTFLKIVLGACFFSQLTNTTEKFVLRNNITFWHGKWRTRTPRDLKNSVFTGAMGEFNGVRIYERG